LRGVAKDKVMVSGSEKREAWAEKIARCCLADLKLAEAVETFGKGGGEASRDVLGDEDGRHVRGKAGEDFLDGDGAAGGCSDGDDGGGEIGCRCCGERNGIGTN
jgi:hypothetical protein